MLPPSTSMLLLLLLTLLLTFVDYFFLVCIIPLISGTVNKTEDFTRSFNVLES